MASTANSTYEGSTAEERAVMKDHAQERKKAARRASRADRAAEAERDVLARIAEMQDADRVMAERVHAVITANAPVLAPKLWYGMPAYALDGKVVCSFQSAAKFRARYATLGFSDLTAPRPVGDRFAERTGFDPRALAAPYLWLRVTPHRVQAWREVDEMSGRELMRDGRWLV